MKTSIIFNLPADVINELHKRLRESNYSGFIELENWLKNLGFNVSKSGIHRYAQKLKSLDGFIGRSGSFDLAVQLNNSIDDNTPLNLLYQELGKLEYQKQQILQKISAMEAENQI
ncbi:MULTISPECIES: phage protein Gp27 family protein [Pasteurellaceae]|uniref:DUF3486 family protein n=2 Tax=Pasteurellaceae TaxID=712 RepID=Q65WC4_MANSM|nr:MULTISPECIES: phage protein Gp27 family protein [Pasteurellaceae]AAU36736.1 unknown [[Mannheimia] succiniciproducens MBEL55E]MDG2949343.1 DUF3486 family protein [Exercitatus varius]